MKMIWISATIALLASLGSQTAGATIIYSGVQDFIIPEGSNAQVTLTFNGVPDSLEITNSHLRGNFNASAQAVPPIFSTIVGDDGVKGFDAGYEIGFAEEWLGLDRGGRALVRYVSNAGEFYDQTDKYMALHILDQDDVYFGWVRMSHSVADQQLIVHDWAWNTVSGEPITAGQIPEPAAVAFFAGLAVLLGILVVGRLSKRGASGPLKPKDNV